MIDNHALARSQDPEVLALGNLMERVLRWIARQDDTAIKELIHEVEDDLEDLHCRDVTEQHRQIATTAYKRQRELLSIARVQRLPPRIPRI